MLDYSPNDQAAPSVFIATFSTRLSAQPLRPLDTLTTQLEEMHERESLPLWKRIDCVSVLNRSVILNQVQDGTFDALPQPGSRLGCCQTKRALLLFYALISRYVFQAQTPPFRFTEYLGQLRFGNSTYLAK